MKLLLCPDSWRHHYLLGERVPRTGAMFLGSCVDDALTHHHRHWLETGERPPNKVKRFFGRNWNQQRAALLRPRSQQAEQAAADSGSLKRSSCSASRTSARRQDGTVHAQTRHQQEADAGYDDIEPPLPRVATASK